MNILKLLLLLFMLFHSITAVEPNAYVHVNHAGAAAYQDQILFDAQTKLGLNNQQMEMLHSGIPLRFIYEIQILRKRNYFFNALVIKRNFYFTLHYHALSDQYLVTHEYLDQQKSFPTLSLALDFIGQLDAIPIIHRHLLSNDHKYWGYMRFWLDQESLPSALKLPAYFSGKWTLDSDWLEWRVPY